MATAPSPFFYSLPSAATYPPPAYDFSPAPQFGYSNFPSAAVVPAYAPYRSPPAFPYASTYPYPPPTSAYTPASGSSPNRPTWPPPAPYPTPFTAQSTTKDERMTLHDVGVLQTHKSSSAVHPTKPVTCQADDLTKGYKTSGASLYGVHKHKGPGTLSKAKNAILHRRQRKLLNLHARLDEQQARERTAVNTLQGQLANLQGQLAKLKLMASQLEISIGKHVSTVHATTVSSSSDICAAVSLSAGSGCSQFDATAAAYVAPQMLDEMPGRYGFHNQSRQTAFLADGTEHSFYGLPENYPLERATLGPVFDAYDDDMDGCSNDFFDVFVGTPEQQKSDQSANCFREAYLNAFSEDTPERVSHAYDVVTKSCSDESVHVFASPPEQQPFEAKQQDSEQLLKCVVKAPETEQAIACLNYISDMFDYTLEQQQQNDEKTSVNVQQLRAPPWHALVIHERRNDWDPGIHRILSSTPNRDSLGFLKTSILTQEITTHLTVCNSLKYLLQSPQIRYPSILSYSFILRYCSVKCDSWLNIVLESTSDQVEAVSPLSLTTPWDLGDLHMHSGITRNSTRTTSNAERLKFSSPTPCVLPHSSSVQWSILSAQYFLYSQMNKCSIFLAGRTLPWNPWCAIWLLHHCSWEFSISSMKRIQWDPGVKVSCYYWLNILKVWSETDKPLSCTLIPDVAARQNQSVASSAYSKMVHVLHMKYSARRSPTSALSIMCFYALGLVWTAANGSALFVLAVPYSICTFVAMQFLFLSNGDTSRTRHPKLFMQSLCASTTVQATEQRHHLEFILMAEMLAECE